MIILLGAVVSAYLPSLMAGIARRGDSPGWSFQLALELLEQLHQARGAAQKGQSLAALAHALRVEALQLEEPVRPSWHWTGWGGSTKTTSATCC
ncbi:hypothetical protein D9M68_820700 [compost metagenome]